MGNTLSSHLHVFWWNGGGALVKRLRVNPVLKSLLSKEKVDIFCYGEALISSYNGKLLNGFECYLHRAHLHQKGNYRRGLAIFFQEKYKFLFSKVYACRKFDIAWMKLVTSTENLFFVSFKPLVITTNPQFDNYFMIFSAELITNLLPRERLSS